MTTERIIDRVRKLLELSHSTNEHEAANAAARAAELMAEHEISEAMLEVSKPDDEPAPHIAERIVESKLDPEHQTRERVAWRDRILTALAASLDCETMYTANPDAPGAGNLAAFGRESRVQAWRYTGMYLIAEVDRLADEAWLREGADLAAVGIRPRAWKAAFRLGAADVIHERLYMELYARKAKEGAKLKALADKAEGAAGEQLALVRVDAAIALLKRDRDEVAAKFKERTKGFRATRHMGNTTRRRSGYRAGREAGAAVNIKGGGRALGGK